MDTYKQEKIEEKISEVENELPEPQEKIDTAQFKPLSSKELGETLELTIKRDEENKLVTFLCALSAYTEESQFNISFNAPSSTGKSYIPLEIARLFPAEDVIEIGYATPKAFFYDTGEFIKEKKGYNVDLERKIIIFLEQPHPLLLQHLRPLLSHDKKEIQMKMADRSEKKGMRTKNVFIKGFPSVIFCTAHLKIDEQEATRFILLSPESSQEKIREGIQERIKKETNPELYKNLLKENPQRKLLKERIRAIKQEDIKEVRLHSSEKIEEEFFKGKSLLKPRHQRDIARFISLIKAFALLNLWFRKREGSVIETTDEDIAETLRVWEIISESQEFNIPPYVYNLYNDIIVSAWKAKNDGRGEDFEEVTGQLGLERQEIMNYHLKIYGQFLDDWKLRQWIMPMLKSAGLIREEQHPKDKRKTWVFPAIAENNELDEEANNSELGGGVNSSSLKTL
ncbi:MAG: hypothetical protein KJI71_01845 [Patescibacteria group bacterium]|nr:hypothetical protein [Patescibacteria group bacterium]